MPASSTLPYLHVLVADDDPFMLEVITGMLKNLGVAKVTTACDGAQGLSLIAQCAPPPDLVITDLNMPGKDGFQVMEYLSDQGFPGHVALLSGMDERTRNSAALMARFHHLKLLGVFAKPLSRAALAQMLLKSCAKGAANA
jgi:CheY-like chemotaxis protein